MGDGDLVAMLWSGGLAFLLILTMIAKRNQELMKHLHRPLAPVSHGVKCFLWGCLGVAIFTWMLIMWPIVVLALFIIVIIVGACVEASSK